MTVADLLSRLDGVRSRGSDRWSARCPVHSPDRNPSLSICDGDKGILLRCWAGCDLRAIAQKLRIEVKDLFHDRILDLHQQREAMQRRVREQTAKRVVLQAKGRRNDLFRQAEYLIQSARGMNIQNWSDDVLDKRLNTLADAYKILAEEHHDA